MTGSPDHDEGRGRGFDDRDSGFDRGGGARGRPDPFPSGAGSDADLTARLDGGRPDPLEPLLRPPVPHLQAPPGAYERIRRTAARRRRTRALLSGGAAAAVVMGALYVGGSLTSGGGDDVIGPPAGSSGATSVPPPGTTPAVTPSAPPSTSTATTGATGTAPDSPPPTGATGPAQPSGPPPGSSSAPTGHGTPMCTAGQLTAALGGGDAGAGNLYRYLVLTNHGSAPCHLTGYPGLSMLDADGRQIGQPATREPSSYQPVVLQPGGSASDTIHTANRQGTCLPESDRLRIYPPGSLDALVVPGRITECEGVFAITPFAPGSTGNPPG